MKTYKKPFSQFGFAIILISLLAGCGRESTNSAPVTASSGGESSSSAPATPSSGGDSPASTTPLRVLARNVLLGSAVADASIKSDRSRDVDTTTQVLAENVVVETGTNALTSTNLQGALDNELAISLSTLLPGTTWNIVNKTMDPLHSGTTGQISFAANTLTINSGHFAAVGLVAASEQSLCIPPRGPVSYELLSNKVMYITWSSQDAVATVVAQNKDTLVLIGQGGCGAVGMQRISVLTRVH